MLHLNSQYQTALVDAENIALEAYSMPVNKTNKKWWNYIWKTLIYFS